MEPIPLRQPYGHPSGIVTTVALGRLHKQPPVVFKFVELVYHEHNILFAFIFPDPGVQKPLVFAGLGKVHTDELPAGDVSELPVEFRHDLGRKGADGVTGLLGRRFVIQWTAVPQPKTHGRGRHHATRRILITADTSQKRDAGP